MSTAFKECLCFPGRPEISNKTPTDILPQISFSGSNDPRGQISDLPTEVTDIGFGNRCGKPRGPREPPSEWT